MSRSPQTRRIALCLVLAVLLLATGCAAWRQNHAACGARVAPKAFLGGITQIPILGDLLLQFIAPVWDATLGPYMAHRTTDFFDCFEYGIGLGWGFGAQASMGLGMMGFCKGRYRWTGIFGVDQIGSIWDAQFKSIGFPFTILSSASVYGRSKRWPFLKRFGGALLILLGSEDGIGGPGGSSQGYGYIGPVGLSKRAWPMSSSGPVGMTAALGPMAMTMRMRTGAVVNFVFGWIGWHPFPRPWERRLL